MVVWKGGEFMGVREWRRKRGRSALTDNEKMVFRPVKNEESFVP